MVDLYLAPRDTSTLECVITVIVHIPQEAELLVARDFKTDLSAPDGHECDNTIS